MWHLKRYVLALGLPFGLAVAVDVFNPEFFSWIDFIATVAVASIIFGASLSLAAGAYTRALARGWVAKIGLFVTCEVVAVACGMALAIGNRDLPHGGWTRLPSPPESVVAFSGPTCRDRRPQPPTDVVITTTAGHRFGLRGLWHGARVWKPLPDRPSDMDSVGIECASQWSAVEPAPIKTGAVRSSYQVWEIPVECSWYSRYLLMNDGSLWAWGTGGCGLGQVISLLFVLVVTVILGAGAYAMGDKRWGSRSPRSARSSGVDHVS
jgi:hypothetical protein